MNSAAPPRYDVAVVGAGPVGSLCALAHARKGARVALLEANPKASQRLAGEWLHPPAVRMLRGLGLDLDAKHEGAPGKGFVVFPEDRSAPIELPYADGALGLAYEHSALVSGLHEAVANEPDVEFLRRARVRAVADERVTYTFDGTERQLCADRVVGADGRASVVRQSLGLSTNRITCSRMIGVVVESANLPFAGYGHVLLGGPGPILMFHLNGQQVRIIVDVPLDHWSPKERIGLLTDSYAGFLPESLRPAFVDALRAGRFRAAGNELRPRVTYGNARRVLIGDAAGHYHPLTAVGMTLGFGDALALAEGGEFAAFTKGRLRAIRAPELLAMGLYEVFADHRAEAAELRQAVYRNWRERPGVRNRTMGLLACEDVSVARLGFSFYSILAGAVARGVPLSSDRRAWRRTGDMARALAVRIGYFLRGIRDLRRTGEAGAERGGRARDKLARAFLVSMQSHGPASSTRPTGETSVDASTALRLAARRLLGLQQADGGWEGEMVWCPMLAAQYVMLHHIIGQPPGTERRRLVLRQFERTRLHDGCWGLHEHSHAYLFVTALVYVAARLLGVARDDPLIERAGRFLREEGVVNIPSWGKFWLALLNLYEWRGLNAILPELWRLPRWLPLHPSNWYCHTRLIYMAMAAIYVRRFQVPETPLIASLRAELFPGGFADIDFNAGRNRLREADLFQRPGLCLRVGYRLTRLYERWHARRLRERCEAALIERIRWELQSSNHTSISPVSGFLNILALWLRDPGDADCRAALARLEGWIWEDEAGGTRVTGARSASWDTGFALQALATIREVDGVPAALQRGVDFLRRQQIPDSFDGFREAYRNDPRGGWCFAGVWHGWPVTDCTAEAVLGILAAGAEAHPHVDTGAEAHPHVDTGASPTPPGDEQEHVDAHIDTIAAPPIPEQGSIDTDTGAGGDTRANRGVAIGDAVRFMLRGQNRDGGFGSYESQRSRVGLEWLNPAEMFGESMTEHSYVECTASCMAALAASRRQLPQALSHAAETAMARAEVWLRRTQSSDGSWRGVWGVQYIYGTFFGIRGLLAAGARPGDPALRLACRWLLDRQRDDGGWGEHHSGCLSGRYVVHEQSQVIQSAWALIALLEAQESNWVALSRGVKYLRDTQEADGGWPKQDMVGVFFRTALLDYVLYRQYFPLHALGLYETRRKARISLSAKDRRASRP